LVAARAVVPMCFNSMAVSAGQERGHFLVLATRPAALFWADLLHNTSLQ
jgi:hypothetical protein